MQGTPVANGRSSSSQGAVIDLFSVARLQRRIDEDRVTPQETGAKD
jgi:hypothetical protein